MNQNYSWLAEELDLGISAVAQLARNGFLGSFISEDDKELYIKEVDFLEKAFLDL
ncbi:adenine aminohydrolase [Haematococcus lacustris]|uniref:Adenine aminohydrolase n=1 Tax=Haematococcus lacustris TaxID=44745 RepID=A0A6A0AH45_HAELA|nr:adenine aminohydrolase [Haematococcus lacustris]